MGNQSIGHVRKIFRYPFKSMNGEALQAARLTFTGMVGDRVYAFLDPHKMGQNPPNTFPWFSARQSADLLLCKPEFLNPPPLDEPFPSAQQFDLVVKFPTGLSVPSSQVQVSSLRALDPQFVRTMEHWLGKPLTLRFSEKGMHDARPISLIGTATIEHTLAQAAGSDKTSSVAANLDQQTQRFRPNLWIEWDSKDPYFEESLLNQKIKIGQTELLIERRNKRCVIVNRDPVTAQENPNVLKSIGKDRAGNLGVYCLVLKEGIIQAGDVVELV